MAFIAATLIVGFIAGLLLRRWEALLLGLLIPLYYVGLHEDWWGAGVGDFWEVAAVLWTAAAVLGIMIGLVVGRAWFDAKRSRLDRSSRSSDPSDLLDRPPDRI
jgi:hypothetical protein